MFLIESLRISFDKASPFALHIFLVFGVIFYTVAGALIIKSIETPERVRAALKAKKLSLSSSSLVPSASSLDISNWSATRIIDEDPRVRDCLLSSLSTLFDAVGCTDESIDHSAITKIDECYRQISIDNWEGVAVEDNTVEGLRGGRGADDDAPKSKWTFENALIFSFTVITTIGYGHIVPETTFGRVFLILYGIVGVPLTLLTIADLGMFIAKGLHFMLRGTTKVVRALKIHGRKLSARSAPSIEVKTVEGVTPRSENNEEDDEEENERERIPRTLDETVSLCILFTLYLFVGADVLSSYEPEMGFFEAFYFNFVTLTTIGLGDFVPKRMRLDRLIKNLGDQLNIPEEALLNFEVENFVEQAIKVEEGEIACLRKPVRPFSYSTIRKSEDSSRIDFADSTRSSKVVTDTVGLAPLAFETERTVREDVLDRLRTRRLQDEAVQKSVRFSSTSFDRSISSTTMDYSDEDLPTLRV